MKNGKRGKRIFAIFFLLAFALLFSSQVSAKPVTQIFTADNKVSISYPKSNVQEQSENFIAQFRTFNKSSGKFLDNDTCDCNITIINNKGKITYQKSSNYNSSSKFWYNNISKDYFNENGNFRYEILCIDGEIDGFISGTFEVTPTGKIFGVEQSIVYLVLFAFLVSLFGVALNMCINTPWDEGNNPAKINYRKYLKFLYGFLAYVFMMFAMFTGKGLTQYFLPGDTLYAFFNTFSTIMTVALGPVLIASVFFIAFSIASDKRNINALRRNLPQEVR